MSDEQVLASGYGGAYEAGWQSGREDGRKEERARIRAAIDALINTYYEEFIRGHGAYDEGALNALVQARDIIDGEDASHE